MTPAKAAAESMQKALIGLAPDVEKLTQQDIDRVRAHIRDALGHLGAGGGRAMSGVAWTPCPHCSGELREVVTPWGDFHRVVCEACGWQMNVWHDAEAGR